MTGIIPFILSIAGTVSDNPETVYALSDVTSDSATLGDAVDTIVDDPAQTFSRLYTEPCKCQ